MQTIILSDHTGGKQQAARARRHRENERLIADYQARLQARKDRHAESIERSRRARQQGAYGRAISIAFQRVVCSLSRPKPKKPRLAKPSQQERVWAAGDAGEQRTHSVLGRLLSDDWTLLSGYKNAKGEIDGVLVGPDGVIAIEIKNLSGIISGHGDRWWRDKFGRRGMPGEENVPVRDRGGRAPSAQLNQSANKLELMLRRRLGETVVIRRIVVFAHDRAQLRNFSDLTIDWVGTLKALWQTPDHALFDNLHKPDTASDTIVSLIQRDHQDHASQSRRGSQGKHRHSKPKSKRQRD